MLAAEATRVVKGARTNFKRQAASQLKKRKMLSPGVKVSDIQKRIFFNPKANKVTKEDILSGFSRDISVSAVPFNLWAMRPRVKRERVPQKNSGRRTRRYVVYTRIGAETRRNQGAFFVRNKKWVARPGRSRIPAFRREGETRRPLEVYLGSNVVSLLMKANLDKRLIQATEGKFNKDFIRRLNALHRRMIDAR
jgi:hypothetical protein